ncbi:MAG: hypothetical protein MUC81_07560 [Bacteroidia bacterium]|jgi:hypothetical protein|nr:hypothetical protein [Bacteroidia bacterium]
MKKLLAFIIESNTDDAAQMASILGGTGKYDTLVYYSVKECIPHLNIKPDLIVLNYHNQEEQMELTSHLALHQQSKNLVILSTKEEIRHLLSQSNLPNHVVDVVVKNEWADMQLERIAANFYSMNSLVLSNTALLEEVRSERKNMLLFLGILIALFSASIIYQ